MKRTFGCRGFFSITLMLLASFTQAQGKPNVVFIFADDLGYGDLGCYGATKVQTPNIDRLATEGRRFTDAHSASAVCTPSRYALLTGEYPHRKNLSKPVFLKTGLVIDTRQQTIASLMKDAGYATACIGKWHLGFGERAPNWNGDLKPGPLEVGFDYYYGVPVVNSHPPFVYVEDHKVVGLVADDPFVFGKKAKTREFFEKMGLDQIGGADAAHALYDDEAVGTTLAGKAVDWIKARGKDPFFLYLATTNIHHPFTPARRFKGSSKCGPYGDFIHELDWIVGEVMKTLEDQGVADNTLVIFTSDNGGMFNVGGQNAWDAGHRLNGELLGFKFGAWEGGHRVPFIARWAGKIEAGSVSHQLISNIDMLATFAALTGGEVKSGQGRDSVNILPALTGDPTNPLRDHLVLAPSKPTHLAIRRGKWMYIGAQGSGGFTASKRGAHAFGGPAAISYAGYQNSDIENGRIKADAPRAQLYDLMADVKQTKNLHNEHPEVVKELSSLLAGYKPKPGPTQGKPRGKGKPAQRIPAKPSERSASFDFESGKLDPWKVVEGKFGHVLGSRAEFFRIKREYNKQGTYYLTTLEPSADAERGMDNQVGVIVSPLFIPKRGVMTFRVGGGERPATYVALCTEDGKEVQFARGVNDQVMQEARWDLSPYAGKKMFIKVVDQETGGWGHITVDNFQFDGKVLTEYASAFTTASTYDGATESRTARARPNIIFMLTDDLGYSDIGCYGARKVKTPHIDKLAAEGVRFTHFRTAASICSPSRAAFLTGAYPQRCGMYMGINPRRTAHWFLGLHPDEITIAEQLKKEGYAPHMVGKWHLGTEPEFLPRMQGFDSYYGMPCNHSHSPAFYDNDTLVFSKAPLNRLTELYTKRVTSIIRSQAQKGEPFFLYYAHNYPHTPYESGSAFKGSSRDGVRGDVMQELDWGVGEIMATLKEVGIADNTVVIFTSDNGPTSNTYAGPFRGTKYVTFEGGHRVPFIFHWPARVKPGVTDTHVTAMDLFPTLSALTHAVLPNDRIYDGENILPLFEGLSLKRRPTEPFYYYNCENLQAIKKGPWKLHLPRSKAQLPFWDKNKAFADLQEPVLYNMITDKAESRDVSADHPEVVVQIMELAKNARQEFGEFMQRGKSQRPTGTLFPDVPVVSHEKDWGMIDSTTAKAIAAERIKRHPNQPQRNSRREIQK